MTLAAEAHRAYLFAVYVRPEARGRGLAQHLINMACDQARAAGHVQIELNSNAGNIPAVELYKRCGFEVFGHLPRALIIDGVTGDDFLMWRRLDT
jgi:ribosomal protein S18 acetylase RimI-like enzyme